MGRRGATFIELMLVVILTALIVGALAGLYSFATGRTAFAIANQSVLTQSGNVMGEIEKTVSYATSCQTVAVGGGTALKCIMPAQGVDLNGDGYMDTFTPQSVSRRCTERWGTGQRVWYYMSDSAGDPSTSGVYVWRAKRLDDSTPTATDADQSWTFYYGSSNARNGMLSSLTFAVSAAAHTVTVSFSAAQLARASRQPGVGEGALSESLNPSRTIYWRNWRQ